MLSLAILSSASVALPIIPAPVSASVKTTRFSPPLMAKCCFRRKKVTRMWCRLLWPPLQTKLLKQRLRKKPWLLSYKRLYDKVRKREHTLPFLFYFSLNFGISIFNKESFVKLLIHKVISSSFPNVKHTRLSPSWNESKLRLLVKE